jgi:nitroreductase/dihydropteridine reductase
MKKETLDITEVLNWRYATKRMNGNIIPQETIDRILEAIRLAPSGIGLQPYEILVITNPELKKQILPIAANQMPVVESSHLLVFAPWDNYTPARINRVFDFLNEQRGTIATTSDRQRQFALNYFSKFTAEENFHHAAKQAHIALGIALTAAALEHVDATPMEGFNAPELDKFLDLGSMGLRSSMLMALGYRDEEQDWNSKLPKVRKPLSELVRIYQ